MKSGIMGELRGPVSPLNDNAPSMLELSDRTSPVSAGLVCRSSLMGCIYLATNRINGKQYVGKAKYGLSPRRKTHENNVRRGSMLYFHCALRKYGIGNFDWDEVYSDVSVEDLNRLEIECIAWFGTGWPNGYNISLGGQGGDICKTPESRANHKAATILALSSRSQEEKNRWVEAIREALNRPEIKAKARETNSTPEIRLKRSIAQQEAQNRTETKKRHVENGKICSNKPEVKEKNRRAQLKRYEDPAERERTGEIMRRVMARLEVKAKRRETDDKPEVKKRRTEAAQRMWADPEYRENRRVSKERKNRYNLV